MYTNGNRVMSQIVMIDDVVKHPNADTLDICSIGGWKVVSKIGEFKSGDLAIYISIDSWVPHDLAPFLSKGREPRLYNGVLGERVRTCRLRGELSQGLLLPLTVLNIVNMGNMPVHEVYKSIGYDCDELLNIQKWEAPIPACMQGISKGSLPTTIPFYDQERVQNLSSKIEEYRKRQTVFQVEEKLEGANFTAYLIDGEFGVCSRNIDYIKDDMNVYWKVAIEQGIEEKMMSVFSGNVALRMELIGSKIQGGYYGFNGHDCYVFDIYDIDSGKYVIPFFRQQLVEKMGLKHVPILDTGFTIDMNCDDPVQWLLDYANGKSVINPNKLREGVVFKEVNGECSFKSISNSYLLKSE